MYMYLIYFWKISQSTTANNMLYTLAEQSN